MPLPLQTHQKHQTQHKPKPDALHKKLENDAAANQRLMSILANRVLTPSFATTSLGPMHQKKTAFAVNIQHAASGTLETDSSSQTMSTTKLDEINTTVLQIAKKLTEEG